MADPVMPDPVLVVVAALWREAGALARARELLVEAFGPLAYEGEDHPFEVTGYYDREMGAGLQRRLITFEDLADPAFLAAAKLRTNAIEREASPANGRSVNLDVGYLDHHKLVLASAKPAGQKIYLGEGIYADPMFRHAGGRLVPFDWTFPDFRDGRYEAELLELRRRYLGRLREGRRD